MRANRPSRTAFDDRGRGFRGMETDGGNLDAASFVARGPSGRRERRERGARGVCLRVQGFPTRESARGETSRVGERLWMRERAGFSITSLDRVTDASRFLFRFRPRAQLLEASELVSQIEEVFGVDASAPAGGMVMAAGPAAGGEAAEEKTEFDLVIDAVDADKRIAIIKVVRGLTDLGLKEAKDAVTNVPFTILAGKTKGEVEEAKKALEEGGAKCSIK